MSSPYDNYYSYNIRINIFINKAHEVSITAEEGREKSIVVELATEVLADDQVGCSITRFTRPGEAKLGVTLTPTAIKAMYLYVETNVKTLKLFLLESKFVKSFFTCYKLKRYSRI